MRTRTLVAAIALISSPAAFAQGVVTERSIGHAAATEAALAAVSDCLAKGYRVSAAVVNQSGQIKAIVRADGAGPHTLDTSRRKAYTSATFRAPTTPVMEGWQKNPAAQNLVFINDILAVGGGLPIRAGNDVIGAIGVGGAPGGHLDDACAQAGIDKIKDRLN